jgi:hypothetical protein
MIAAPQPAGYASIAAFLAHYRALESSPELDADERRILAAMRAQLDSLESDERAALQSPAADSTAGRRRDRALRKLRRELLARGTLSG